MNKREAKRQAKVWERLTGEKAVALCRRRKANEWLVSTGEFMFSPVWLPDLRTDGFPDLLRALTANKNVQSWEVKYDAFIPELPFTAGVRIQGHGVQFDAGTSCGEALLATCVAAMEASNG